MTKRKKLFISRRVDWKLLVLGISIVLAAFGLKDSRVDTIISQLLPDVSQTLITSASITPTILSQEETVVVKRVVDGDTIELIDGRRVRYIGINAPELSAQNGKTCYGREATAKNITLVEGKTIRMVKDISDVDKYQRLLRYVWVGDIFVNEILVREGFAQVSTFPPDVLYKDGFLAAEKQARGEMIGLWGSICTNKK